MGKAEVDAFFADDPAPAAPVAPAPTSKVDAFFASDRAPSQESAALDPGELTRLGGDLWQTVYRGRKDEGENEDAAVKAANASVEALRAVGPDADKGRVRDALAAHVGPDTLDKTLTRAFGQRVYAAPLAEPNRAARDDARRASEQEFRRATGIESIPDAWTKGAGDTGPRMVTEDEVKPWLQRTKAAAENIAAGVLTAGTLPLISKVAEWSGYAPILPDAPTPFDVPRTVGDVLNDRDVATLAGVDLDKKTIDPNTGLPGIVTGLVAKTPIPDAVDYVKIPQAVAALADSMKARGVPVPDVDAQTWVRFWDDARDYEAFDAANAAYYETGDRSKVDAIAFDQLPATLRGERPNAAMAKAAAESGDPDFAPLLQYADADEGFYQKQVEKLPIGALARLQTDVAPTFAELEQAFKARADAKKWRGDDQGQAALRLMSAGMLAPVGDGKALVVVPSKAAEAARLANTVWSGLMNADLGVGGGDTIGEKIVGLPTALPRAALYLAEEAGVEGAGTLRKRIEGSRLPTARGLETMATNPAFDDAMRFLGLATSQDYDVLDDPDSTWLSRTLADIADPEYGARHWADFLRRGGESESSTAMKAAEFADIAEQFVIPAEELALAPLTRSVAALNRARAAAYVARETGASSREARALALDAMRPRAYLDRDVIESANERLTRTALEGVANGTLDPDKVSPNVKRQVGEILNRTIGYSEDDVAKMWDDLRDRRMRILDTAKDIEMSGGPRTRELRASNEYRDTMRGLDDLVRTQNLSPQDRDVMRAFLEASAFSAYDRGAVGSPEEYFARHSWERGVEGEALPVDTLYQERAPRPPTLAQQIRDTQFVPTDDIVNILGTDRPAYLDEVSKFILEQREKVRSGNLAPRDVAKAYLITVASQNARSQSAAGVERLLGHRLDDRFIVMDQGRRFVRPEEATAAWLAEPIGKQTLDALDRGEWFQEGWDDFMRVRDAFGSNGVRTHGLLDAAPEGQISLRNVRDAVEGINAAGGDPAQVMDVLGKMRGIGTGKAPFIGHLLGFGEMPTMDAREIAAWMTGKKVVPADAPNAELAKAAASGKPPVSKAFMQRMIDGFERVRASSGLGADLPSETFGAIMHHWLWDRIANEATTHEGVYHTMRYASESPGTVHGSIEQVSDARAAGRAFAKAEVDRLIAEGATPVSAAMRVRDALPRRIDAMTERDLGIRDYLTGAPERAPKPRKVRSAVPVETPEVAEARIAAEAASRYANELRRAAVARGESIAYPPPMEILKADQAAENAHWAYQRATERARTLRSETGGTVHGSISPGTPDTVNVPNPDYAAWEARINALSAEVDALRAAPAEVPNPARAEWEAKGKATAAEVDELRAASNREMADLQARRESLQKNPRPDDPDWEAEVEEVNDRIGEITRTTSVNPTLAAKEAELAAMRANPPAATLPADPDGVVAAKAEALARLRRFEIPKEVPKPSDVSRWLIKLFRTGDVKTAFHEGTHLLDLMMGEEWTRRAMEALGYDPTGPITTEVRERIAEAGTRALRGTLRPGSKLGNVFEDVRDVMGDVWRRVRNEPAITTPKFKRFWDQQFRPTNGTMELAAKIVDERTPASRFGRVVQGGTAADEIAEALPARIGAAKQATNTIRGDAEMRQALGLTNDMDEIPVQDILAKALAYVGTEKLRRTWGMGDLTGLTARTVVPTARAQRVKQEVAAYRAAVLGGAPPRPKVADGVEVFELTPTQARGMRRMLDELANQPIAATLPDRLLEPGADLTRMTPEEWESVVTHQLEMRAGAGAWRDRVAEAAQVSGAQRLIDLTVTTAEHSDLTKIPDAIRNIREKFVVDTPGSNYTTNPAVIEMFAAFSRDIGSAPGRVARRIQEIQRKGKGWREAFREIGAGIPPEVVPVTALEDLRGAARVVSATDVAEVTERVPEISRLFAASPIDSVPQMAQEQRALSILDSIGARMGGAEPPPPDVQFAPEIDPDAAFGSFEQSAARFSDALADAGVSPAQAADAMATVQEGIRRRVAAVEDLGADILVTFAGSKDRAILNGINDPAVRSAYMQEAYANWYTGDWERIFRDVTTDQHKVFQSPKYDQGTAILNVLVRLETRRVFGSLARRMAEAGVGGDVARVLEAGNRYDRPYVFGSLTETGAPGDVSITGQRYIAEVAGYIESIAGGHETTVFRPELPDGTREATSVARGERTAGGAVNLAAYADAQRILQQFGFQPFKGAAWSEVDLPGGAKVMLPDVWKDPIQKVLDEVAPMGGAYGTDGPKLGAFVPGTEQPAAIQVQAANLAIRTLFNSYGYAMGMLKTGLTTGMGPLIRPGFFVGNAFGGLFQLYQGVGAVDALKIITRPLLPTDEGATIRRVLARMWRDGEGAFGRTTLAPAESGFFDPVGRWWSDQRVAASANRAGLNSSLVKSEFTHAIIEDIKASDPTLWNRLTNNPKLGATVGAVAGGVVGGVGGAVAGGMVGATLNRRWQSFMHEGATAIDNYYRVSTYVDALRRGVPEAEAANLARRVAFDYNALTDFEKKLSRNVVLFYAYQRNAQNLFWWTMLNHPSRIMGQLRALNGVQQQTYEKDADLYAPSWGDGRFQFDFRPAFKEGHAANAMKGAVTLSPSTGIADTIGVWQSLLGMSDLSAASFGELAAKVNPWIQSVPVMYSGKDPYSQRSIEGFNKIPNWLIEMDANLTGGQLKEMFNAQQVQTRNEATQDYPGAPEWVVGPGEVPGRAWWVFRQLTLAGSTMDTITAMQRADVGQSLVGEHGFVQAAVDTSRKVAPILGNEPTPYVEDVGMARSGLTEAEEFGGWLGFKPVQVPLREQALGRAQRVREGEIKDKIRAEKDRAERRYR